jgi:hypothetical protein
MGTEKGEDENEDCIRQRRESRQEEVLHSVDFCEGYTVSIFCTVMRDLDW